MLDEARKREKIANAVLGLAFATSAAQSPRDFVKSGHIESPGVAMMQRTIGNPRRQRKNLDNPRVLSRGAKTFKEFVEESYLIEERQQYFSSRAELEKHHGGIPSGHYANNAGSTENPKWRLKPKSGLTGERTIRAERIEDLSSAEERAAADRKMKRLKEWDMKDITSHHYTIQQS